MYQVIDRQTQEVKGTYKSRTTANKKADRLDDNYGAYRFYVKAI